jgi:hypothetical protein
VPTRQLALAAYAICKTNGCGHYGTDHSGSTGCLQLPKPCSLLDRLYVAVQCPAGYFVVVQTDGNPSLEIPK